jgi:hypothetical protein
MMRDFDGLVGHTSGSGNAGYACNCLAGLCWNSGSFGKGAARIRLYE